MGRECGMSGGEQRYSTYRILAGKTETNRLLGRPRRRWHDNVKINVGETGRDKWFGLWNGSVNSHLP